MNFNCDRLNMNHVMTPVKTEFYFTVIFLSCLDYLHVDINMFRNMFIQQNPAIRNIKLFNHHTRIDSAEAIFVLSHPNSFIPPWGGVGQGGEGAG